MSTYTRNQPVATDSLSISQPILLANTNAADDSFGVDHYKFSDTTPNNGFHNKVTQPLIVGSAHPTTTTNPIIYAMQDSANVGVIQYSRGVSNAVPSPITNMQSSATPLVLVQNVNSPVLDFTGLSFFHGLILGTNSSAFENQLAIIIWNGSAGAVVNVNLSATPQFRFVGAVLNIYNPLPATLSNVRWTLDMYRLQ